MDAGSRYCHSSRVDLGLLSVQPERPERDYVQDSRHWGWGQVVTFNL